MAQVLKFLLSIFLTSAAASISLIGCSKSGGVDTPPDTKPYLTLKNSLPAFNAPGGTDDWYEVTPMAGAKGENISVRISVQKNEKYTGRGFTLTLASESLERKIEVTQHKKMESFFAIGPTKSYRDYFTVHLAYAVSRKFIIGENYSTETTLGITQSGLDLNIYTARQRLPDYYRLPIPYGVIPPQLV